MEKIRDNIFRFSKNNNNAYLIKSDVNILIDGVGYEFADEYIKSVGETVGFSDISYIVINHCEPNRIGTLEPVLKENRDITVVATTPALKFIEKYTGVSFKSITVKDGTELCGLLFRLTPYINWPDSMLTFFDDVLFSCDLFSSTASGPGDYYSKYLSQRPQSVSYAIDVIKNYKLSCILPGSGMAVNADIDDFTDRYRRLLDSPSGEILILYHSVYGNTCKMAKTAQKLLVENDIPYKMYDISVGRYDELAEKIDKCKALMLGTDTVNADAPADLWNIIALTNKVINKQKPCMLFGTYAWSGEGLYYMEHYLKMLRYMIYEKPFGVQLKMNGDEEKQFEKYTEKFINSLE